MEPKNKSKIISSLNLGITLLELNIWFAFAFDLSV